MEKREAVKELIRCGKIRCVFVNNKNNLIGSPKVLEVLKDLLTEVELNADGDFLGTFVINGKNSSREHKTRRRPSHVNHKRERNLYHSHLKRREENEFEKHIEAKWRNKHILGDFNYANSCSQNMSANSHTKSKGRPCQLSHTEQRNKSNKVSFLKSVTKGKKELSKFKPKSKQVESSQRKDGKSKISRLATLKKQLKGEGTRSKVQNSGNREAKKGLVNFIKIPKLMIPRKTDTTKTGPNPPSKRKLQDFIRVPKFGDRKKQGDETKKGLTSKLLTFTKLGERKQESDAKKTGETEKLAIKVGPTKNEAGPTKARPDSAAGETRMKETQQGKVSESDKDAEKCPRKDTQYQFDVDGTFQDSTMRQFKMPLYGNLAIGPGSKQYCCNNFAELQEHMLNNLIDALGGECDCKGRRKIRKRRRRGMPWLNEELGDDAETSCSISRYLRRKERKVMGQLEVSNQFIKFAEIPPAEMLMYGLCDGDYQEDFINERHFDLPRGGHCHESHERDLASNPNCLGKGARGEIFA